MLMFSLQVANWERLVGWLIVGLLIYFSYGVRHSRLRIQHAEKNAASVVGKG